ncbi:bifunctional diguanylate cyclase/phosphodiesterase [Pengzhenrongella sp.]|uniref:putative bifunctional diguanylate cyclase/phosphodiesterase n=1 Tax=Pengzhenrongella sp. TaxID=2888820 RepID=UPI002F95FBE5
MKMRSPVLVAGCVTAGAALLVMLTVILAQPFGAAIDVAVVDIMELGFAFAGAAGCAFGVARTGGRLRRAFACLLLACTSWGIGQLIWTVYEVGLGRETPFPSLADLGYLGFVPAAVAAIWLLPSHARAGDRRRHVLSGLTVGAAVTLISWSTVLGPTVQAGADSPFSLAVSMAYPISDIVLVTVALLALAQGSAHRVPLLLVTLGMCAMAISDGAFAFLIAIHDFSTAGLVDLGWCLAFTLIGLGGLVSREAEHVRVVERSVVAASALPYVPLVVAAVVVLVRYFAAGSFDRVSAVLTTVLVVLVLARQYATVRDNQMLARTITRREAELRHQAFHDGLTGLANRALFTDRVEHALELHRRDHHPVSVAFLDLDGFKGVNDLLGHAAGDELLVRVAERLRGAVRSADTVARFGGDEFALLMEHGDEPAAVAHGLVEALQAPFYLDGRSVAVSASIGVAIAGADADGALVRTEDLLGRADIAMYAVKRSGRNNFLVHTSNLRLAEVDDMAMRQALGDALSEGRIRAALQPIVDLRTDAVVGVESLARWTHDGAQVPPNVFIPVAERGGLISSVTSLMLDHACRQLAHWSTDPGRAALTVSVNVSAQEVGDPSLTERVRSALERHGVPANLLILEITESALIAEPDAARAVLTSVHDLGVSIWLDDFGTGYNGFAQLIGVPLDSVKLDQSFVADLDSDPRTRHLLDGVITLLHHLGVRVVAEGVERPDQLEALRELGCDAAQGYLLGRPMDVTNVDAGTGAPQDASSPFAVG